MNKELATIPFWKHEYKLWQQKKSDRKIIIAAVTTLVLSNLAWICVTKKH